MPNAYGGRGLPRYVKQPKTASSSSPTTPNNNQTESSHTPTEQSEGETSPTPSADPMVAQYAYWMNQVASYGGYYPPEFAYGTDPNYYYVDPTTSAYVYNGTFYPNYAVPEPANEETAPVEETTAPEGEVETAEVNDTETSTKEEQEEK